MMVMDHEKATTLNAESSEFTPRQDEILDEALGLIRSEGLAGLTMRKVADRMGFTEPAVYRHFKTKGDLVLGVIRRLEIDLVEPMQVIAAQTGRPVLERIGDIIGHHLDLVADNNALPLQLFAEASVSTDERLSRAMADVFGAYEAILMRLLKEGRKSGEITSNLTPADGALILMGAPTISAMRLRLLRDAPGKSRRKRLTRYINNEVLSPREVTP